MKEEIDNELENAAFLLLENDNNMSDALVNKLKAMKHTMSRIVNDNIEEVVALTEYKNKSKMALILGREEYYKIKKSSEIYGVKSLSNVNQICCDDYYKSGSEMLNSIVEGIAEGDIKSKQGRARDIPLWTLTLIEITDRIRRLQNQRFISPVGLGRNYFLYKHTGSRFYSVLSFDPFY